ncbi:MAG: hypothetical protein AAF658_16845, partial [Myxococcota bacterium]
MSAHFAFLAASLLASPPSSGVSAAESPGTRDASTVVSAQIGAGYSSGAVWLLRPRFHFRDSAALHFTLGAPIVLGEGRDAFDSPEAWASWLESLHLDLDGMRLDVGPLVEFGDGLTVTNLTSRLGPVQLRSGLVAGWEGERIGLEVFSDGVLDPRVVGAQGRYRWGGTATALNLEATSAVDPRAPSRLGVAPVGAGDLGLRLSQRLTDSAQLDVRGGAGVLLRERPVSAGAKGGLSLSVSGESARMTLGGEYRWAGRDYIASYFDRLYSIERESVGAVAKADLTQESGAIARGFVEVESSSFSFAMAAERGAVPGQTRVDVRVEASGEDWQLRGLFAQRAVEQAADLVELGDSTVAMFDGSHRLWKSLFAFATVSHRVESG